MRVFAVLCQSRSRREPCGQQAVADPRAPEGGGRGNSMTEGNYGLCCMIIHVTARLTGLFVFGVWSPGRLPPAHRTSPQATGQRVLSADGRCRSKVMQTERKSWQGVVTLERCYPSSWCTPLLAPFSWSPGDCTHFHPPAAAARSEEGRTCLTYIRVRKSGT